MIQANELVGVLLSALLMPIGPTRPVAAPEDDPDGRQGRQRVVGQSIRLPCACYT
jgi:hypothetical protein